MSILLWSETLRVNIDVIDNQHQKLLELANNFYEEVYKGSDVNTLVNSLKELNDYSVFHFQTEEKLLIQFHHPETSTHKKEHTEFINELAKLNSQIVSGKLTISVEFINFLRNSIINHIFNEDKSMAKYFASNHYV